MKVSWSMYKIATIASNIYFRLWFKCFDDQMQEDWCRCDRTICMFFLFTVDFVSRRTLFWPEFLNIRWYFGTILYIWPLSIIKCAQSTKTFDFNRSWWMPLVQNSIENKKSFPLQLCITHSKAYKKCLPDRLHSIRAYANTHNSLFLQNEFDFHTKFNSAAKLA